MKHTIVLIVVFTIGFWSCEKTEINKSNVYSGVYEIVLPTDSPRGLAFDGEFLWYGDDAERNLYKISSEGDILQTIKLNDCRITGFDFYENHIWCINDTTVLFDTTISHYPFSCIYKFSLSGEKMDSILIQASVNPQRPEFLGLTICNSTIYGSTNQGWSSCLYKVDFENKESAFLRYHYISGLTSKNDTIYGIDAGNINKNQVLCFDSEYKEIEDKAIEFDFQGSDLAFVDNELWICDRENKKLKKIK